MYRCASHSSKRTEASDRRLRTKKARGKQREKEEAGVGKQTTRKRRAMLPADGLKASSLPVGLNPDDTQLKTRSILFTEPESSGDRTGYVHDNVVFYRPAIDDTDEAV